MELRDLYDENKELTGETSKQSIITEIKEELGIDVVEENIKSVVERNNILKAIYVGDTIKDYESANKNKLRFIWTEYGFGKCDKYYKKIIDISELINMEI